MKGLREKQLQRFIEQERERYMAAALANYDNAVQRIKEVYEAMYQDEEDMVLVPATQPPKDKEEASSSESSISSVEDEDIDSDEDDDDLDDFIDDAEPVSKKIKTYSKREAATWVKPPAAPKRIRRAPLRFEPDVPDKATAKREREAEQGAETLTSANARATKDDKRELKLVHKFLDKYTRGEWTKLNRDSTWFRARYGSVLDAIRSALGRENAGQTGVQEIFDKICNDTFFDRDTEPNFKPRTNVERVKCCLCNEKKSCHEWMIDIERAEVQPIGSICANLARALVGFFATLRDGGSVDDLDNAFLRVTEAHEAKSSSKRRR